MALKLYLTDGSTLDFPALSAVKPFPGDDAFLQGLDAGQTAWLLIPTARVNAVEIH